MIYSNNRIRILAAFGSGSRGLLIRGLSVGLLALLLVTLWSSAVQAQISSYRLAAGDVVSIRVFGEPDLSIDKVLITDAGSIPYPFMGQIDVKGRTIGEVRRAIIAGLKPDYLINPKVTISIVEYRKFYVNGEVKLPGGFSYQPGLTVRQAIALAGGFTERAEKEKISLVREAKSGSETMEVELGDLVRPGDTLTVEESFF